MSSKRAYAIELEGGEYYNIFQMKLSAKELKFLNKFQSLCNSGESNRKDEFGSIRIHFEKAPHEKGALK